MVMPLPRLRGSSYCHAGMTPQQIAEVRPRLLAFAGQMFGGLVRKDQRAAGELYVRGLLTDGQRKSMQPMAARLGVDHQRLQQFITSSTWDYVAVRRNVARPGGDRTATAPRTAAAGHGNPRVPAALRTPRGRPPRTASTRWWIRGQGPGKVGSALHDRPQ